LSLWSKNMFKNTQVQAVGIAWFRDSESYQKALSIFNDADNLPSSYGEWLLKTKQLYKVVKRSGKIPVKAEIDPDTFPEWCRDRGLNIDADARMEFANSTALEFIQNII